MFVELCSTNKMVYDTYTCILDEKNKRSSNYILRYTFWENTIFSYFIKYIIKLVIVTCLNNIPVISTCNQDLNTENFI